MALRVRKSVCVCVFCLSAEAAEVYLLACFLPWSLEGHPIVVWLEAWPPVSCPRHLMLQNKTSEVLNRVSGGRPEERSSKANPSQWVHLGRKDASQLSLQGFVLILNAFLCVLLR